MKINVTFSNNLHQEEFEGHTISVTEDGDLLICDEDQCSERTILLSHQWLAFAAAKE